VIDRLADILEMVGSEIESISRTVFSVAAPGAPSRSQKERPDYTAMLERVGRCAELSSKARESLLSLIRVASFYLESQRAGLSKDVDEHWRTVRSDLTSLIEHAGFLASKGNFILDAILGMINIEQNTIIKIFSVAAVVFLPPTLVASIYGMNFKFMPEQEWSFGYPLAIALMIISALLPCWFFKRRGWL
jgi:magnesium transporter